MLVYAPRAEMAPSSGLGRPRQVARYVCPGMVAASVADEQPDQAYVSPPPLPLPHTHLLAPINESVCECTQALAFASGGAVLLVVVAAAAHRRRRSAQHVRLAHDDSRHRESTAEQVAAESDEECERAVLAASV
eukprot:COSAG04_NODE_5158_length_1717_cov_6.498764_3_plen_134_part_00